MTTPTFGDFMRDKVGKNYVIAPRASDGLRARYGDDVVVVTPARNRALTQEYRALYGDPYDAVRAEMYRTLREFRDTFGQWSPMLAMQADKVMEAEVCRA